MQFLGGGISGTVHKARDLFTGAYVAVKVMHKRATRVRSVWIEELVYRRLTTGYSPSVQ